MESVQGCHKLRHCLGVRGKRGEIKADRVNCHKSLVRIHFLAEINLVSLGKGFSTGFFKHNQRRNKLITTKKH